MPLPHFTDPDHGNEERLENIYAQTEVFDRVKRQTAITKQVETATNVLQQVLNGLYEKNELTLEQGGKIVSDFQNAYLETLQTAKHSSTSIRR